MLPASYGSPAATLPVLPETGSSCWPSPQMALVAALARLLMVSMVLIDSVLGASRLVWWIVGVLFYFVLCSCNYMWHVGSWEVDEITQRDMRIPSIFMLRSTTALPAQATSFLRHRWRPGRSDVWGHWGVQRWVMHDPTVYRYHTAESPSRR